MFVNADYLGKLFHAECGERFSSYVTRKRIGAAKKLIEENHEITIYYKFSELTEIGKHEDKIIKEAEVVNNRNKKVVA